MLLNQLLEVLCVDEKIKVEAINSYRVKRTLVNINCYDDREQVKDFYNNRILHVYVEDNTTVILIKE